LGKNDWEVFTGNPQYLQKTDFFSDNEFIAADEAFFEGDSHLSWSFKNLGTKKLWNLAFSEVRTLIKKQVLGFLLSGNNKCKLPYSDKVLFLAIHAVIRQHNFNMNIS
jgi:hypothetical protein